MKKKHIVIYIPGLGDHRINGQQRAVNLWRWYGVEGEIYQMLWRDRRHLDEKLEGLVARIDERVANGYSVSLVAASAGASAALNAYAARKDVISGVALICGKVHNGHRMHPSVVHDNIAFGHALERLPDVLDSLTNADRKRIMSVHPLADESVPIDDTRIDGTVERTIPVMGHFFGIAFGLTLYAPFIMRFLKQQNKIANYSQ